MAIIKLTSVIVSNDIVYTNEQILLNTDAIRTAEPRETREQWITKISFINAAIAPILVEETIEEIEMLISEINK